MARLCLSGDEFTDLVVQRLRDNAGRIPLRVLVNFSGLETETVKGWLKDTRPLGGLATLKLWHLLALVQVPSPELEELKKEYPLGEYIGRLLAFGVIEPKEAGEICDVKLQAVYKAARGDGRLVRITYNLEELQELYGEKLDGICAELAEASAASVETEPEIEEPSAYAIKKASVSTTAPLVQGDVLLDLATKLLTALAVANFAAELAPEQREYLRRIMGERNMFDLSNGIDRLCSERAFGQSGGTR